MKKTLKKTFIFFVVFIQICAISSCTKKDTTEDTTYSETVNDANESSYKTTEIISREESTDIGDGGGIITVQKYRAIFYNIPAPFADVVGRDNYWEWYNSFEADNISELMAISEFVKYFNITREQFDKANFEWARGVTNNLDMKPCVNPKDYANQMFGEIYNPDIIFTFDDDLIREYYRSPDYPYVYDFEFEEAVARGEYTSQTEEWVDVEAMGAEIIAKYGEAEIVTETTISLEETIITEQTETDIAEQTEVIM